MSLLIENTEELLTVVKKLNLKVANVDELRHLLAEINANYNPEAARLKTAKLIGVAVPSAMASAAAFISLFLVLEAHGGNMTPYHVGALALIWGACAVVSTAAVIASAILSGSCRRNASAPLSASDQRNMLGERIMTGITKELP
jgi:hypothetical protein